MSSPPDNRRPLAAVDAAFRSLPDRYLGANPGFDATYHIRLGDLGHIWEVRCTGHAARVRKGGTRRQPDVTISTDSDTWMRLRQGEFSGIEAFERRLLRVRGNLDYAVGFEGMFRLPNGRPPLLQIRDVPVGRHRISTMTMGYGPDVLLLHGLGSTRASLFETAAALSTNYRVHAPDLPGFGCGRRSDRRRVPPHLPLRRRALRFFGLGAQHLSRSTVWTQRLLLAAVRAPAPGAVRMGQPRSARAACVQPPCAQMAARRRAGNDRFLWPCSPGRATGAHQRPAEPFLCRGRRPPSGDRVDRAGCTGRRGRLIAPTSQCDAICPGKHVVLATT